MEKFLKACFGTAERTVVSVVVAGVFLWMVIPSAVGNLQVSLGESFAAKKPKATPTITQVPPRVPSAITVISPNNNKAAYTLGDPIRITWQRNWMPKRGSTSVTLYYLTKGQKYFIAANVPDTASGYLWTSNIPGNDFKIFITTNGSAEEAAKGLLQDESDGTFSILPKTSVTPTPTPVTKPLSVALVKIDFNATTNVLKGTQNVVIATFDII